MADPVTRVFTDYYSSGATYSSGSPTTTGTFNSQAGDFLVVAVTSAPAGSPSSASCTDGSLTAGTLLQYDSSREFTRIFYRKITADRTGDSVTVNWSASTNQRVIYTMLYRPGTGYVLSYDREVAGPVTPFASSSTTSSYIIGGAGVAIGFVGMNYQTVGTTTTIGSSFNKFSTEVEGTAFISEKFPTTALTGQTTTATASVSEYINIHVMSILATQYAWPNVIQTIKKNVEYPNGSTSDSATITGVTAGSTLVAIACINPSNGNNGETAAISSDSSGDTWPAAVLSRSSIMTPYATGMYAWVLKNAKAGTHTVNFTQSNNGSYYFVLIELPPSLTDTSAVTYISGSSSTTITATGSALTGSRDIVIAAIGGPADTTGTSTNVGISDPPTGYTSIAAWQNDVTYLTGEVAYKVVSSTAAPSATWSWSGGGYVTALILAFSSTGAKIKLYSNGAFQAVQFIEGTI